MIQSSWSVKVIKSTEDVSLGAWGDIFFTVFKARVDAKVTDQITDDILQFVASRPNGIGMVTFIKKNAGFPSRESRDIMADKLSKVKISGSVAIMEGLGFRAAAVRGAITGLLMVLPQRYPHKVYNKINDACAWLTSTVTEQRKDWKFTPLELERAFEDFLKKT